MGQVYDARYCRLGEGPLWHPERNQLYWFDITACKMLFRDGSDMYSWQFDEMVSAAGWVSKRELLIASETALLRFELDTAETFAVVDLEADDSRTRSNDGRADPWGGFWIGTMGKNAEPGLGAIYRYYEGELRRLYSGLTIPNAISFTPDRKFAQFTDTPSGEIKRVALGRDGWPDKEPVTFLDLSGQGLRPDGAVIDAQGNSWIAQWGAARVAVYNPRGQFTRAVELPAPHVSCPAFGSVDLSTLYCTTALQGMDAEARAQYPDAGRTFAVPAAGHGQREHRVILQG